MFHNGDLGYLFPETLDFVPGAEFRSIPKSNRVKLHDNRVGTKLMPKLIDKPALISAAGNAPKQIEEFVGRVNSGHQGVSIARMISPSGWKEPGQRPDFQEITVVLKGMLQVEHKSGVLQVTAGQAIVTEPGEWIRYSTPDPAGAEYIAVCLPAFSLESVHRESD